MVAVQAHGGGHGPLNGAAAPLPGVFPAVSVGSLVPEKEELLRWECPHLVNGHMPRVHTDYFIYFFTSLWTSIIITPIF